MDDYFGWFTDGKTELLEDTMGFGDGRGNLDYAGDKGSLVPSPWYRDDHSVTCIYIPTAPSGDGSVTIQAPYIFYSMSLLDITGGETNG
jgi:hypothetical protein